MFLTETTMIKFFSMNFSRRTLMLPKFHETQNFISRRLWAPFRNIRL